MKKNGKERKDKVPTGKKEPYDGHQIHQDISLSP